MSYSTERPTVPPLSPFSEIHSVHTEATSDDPPDLGAFDTVLRALNAFQLPPERTISLSSPRPLSRPTTDKDLHNGLPDYDSDSAPNSHSHSLSTVWDQLPIRDYISSDREHDPASSDDDFATDTEEDKVLDFDMPSLGALDAALDFLAGERAKLAAQRVQPREVTIATSLNNSVSPRRKRRRKRRAVTNKLGEDTINHGAATIAPTPELSYSSAELSSSPENHHPLGDVPGLIHLGQSRSTPNLLLHTNETSDPSFTQLHHLARKLAHDFPTNSASLLHLPRRALDSSTGEYYLDPRGPSPPPETTKNSPLIHVFIDHSNILIGFLSFLKRNSSVRRSVKVTKWHISHPALILVLERGRRVLRRVLAASSPLYQPLDTAEQLGYEVRIFARVPDLGDGMDRLNRGSRRSLQSPGDSSDAGVPSSSSRRPMAHSRTTSAPTNYVSSSSANTTSSVPQAQAVAPPGVAPVRIRYREQGVDELLQLKIHQALLSSHDPPPTGSTIVLATGDGNIGQFNEDGFIGCVRSALRKGWKVELYAWGGGLSRAWAREFGSEEGFSVVELERYGRDLIL